MKKEVELLLYLMNEEISLFEVNFNGESHWFKIKPDAKELIELAYQSSGEEVVNGNSITIKLFEDGELRFDGDFGKFIHNNSGHIIMSRPVAEVPKHYHQMLAERFSKN